MLHKGNTEVGAFGISSEKDLLLVEDIVIPKQECTSATVEFDEDAVANHYMDFGDKGISPERCGRIWIHTHPGFSSTPSATDEETFFSFAKGHWAIMAIISDHNPSKSYARLRFNVGPGRDIILPVDVDWSIPFEPYNKEIWAKEYNDNVKPRYTYVGGNYNHCGYYDGTAMRSYYQRSYFRDGYNCAHDPDLRPFRYKAAEPYVRENEQDIWQSTFTADELDTELLLEEIAANHQTAGADKIESKKEEMLSEDEYACYLVKYGVSPDEPDQVESWAALHGIPVSADRNSDEWERVHRMWLKSPSCPFTFDLSDVMQEFKELVT